MANEGADLPDLPDRVSAVRVTFPPNDLHELESGTKEAFLDAFRIDKGRRVLAGMLAERNSRFFMIVDDDDFVSDRIVDFVSRHQTENGWKIDRGYVWGDGGRALYKHDDFANYCGTCLIIRSDLYKLPEQFSDASATFIKEMLGSHVRIAGILADQASPLAALPFRGAIYRVGHPGAHSRSEGVLKKYVFNTSNIKDPIKLLRNLFRISAVNPAIRAEYFGEKQ